MLKCRFSADNSGTVSKRLKTHVRCPSVVHSLQLELGYVLSDDPDIVETNDIADRYYAALRPGFCSVA